MTSATTSSPKDLLTIHSLPDEILSHIFSFAPTSWKKLGTWCICARVCHRWTDLAASWIYRNVEIKTARHETILHESAWERYHTSSLTLKDVSWKKIYGMALDLCPGLLELKMEVPEFYWLSRTSRPDVTVFRHPSLSSLEVLELFCEVESRSELEGAAAMTDSVPVAVSFQLRKLVVSMRTSQKQLLQEIVTASASTLTSLELHTHTSSRFDFDQVFSPFLTIAANLTTFALWDHTLTEEVVTFHTTLKQFLNLATSLTEFSFSVFYYGDPQWSYLTELLTAIDSPLRTLTIALENAQFNDDVLNALNEALEGQSLSMSALGKIEFTKVSLGTLEQVSNVGTFSSLIMKKKVELVTAKSEE